MDFTEIIKELLNGSNQNFRLEVTVESLREFGYNIAEITANKILSSSKLPENPISEKEACERHKKSRQTMAKYRKEGKIRYHRFGREVWYFPSELNEDMSNF